jgi:FG-GAP repeat/Putative Ig domain
MRTAKSRVIIRHFIVLPLLIFLALATPRCWRGTKAESATTTEGLPTLRGEEAITHLKERGLYASLGEAINAARYNAQALPPGVNPLQTSSTRLEAGDGAAGDYFGAAVAISGHRAIVGAPRNDINGDAGQGAAYIFVRSGGVWTQEARLKAPLGTLGDFFGGSVDISGDTAIVGAYLDDSVTNVNQGAVYVFTRSADVWTQQDKLKADDGGANDFFGFSVAIDGDTAIIGAHLNDSSANGNQGAAYVFKRADETWTQTQKLTASDAAVGDLFGFSVALDAETAVIGAGGKVEGGNVGAGAAYVFTLSGETWREQQKLLPDISAAGNFFGASVAISGDTALIGAWGDDIGENADQGSAVVFVRSGETWTKQKKLTAADGSADDKFGLSVAISGDTAVIGVIGEDFGYEDQGAAYVFSRVGTEWSQQPRLFAPDGEADDKFGAPVAVSGDTVVVGASFDDIGGNANQGSAHVFEICQSLTEQDRLTGNIGAESEYFGVKVAISGDTAVVGAKFDTVDGNEKQGSAYVFVRNGARWTRQQMLTGSDSAKDGWFGSSVGISGDTVIVGATNEEVGANTDQGAAYIFVRNGTTWTQQKRLTSSDGEMYDYFGNTVAISGDTAIVGAESHDTDEHTRQGAAYIYVRSGATWTERQKLVASDGVEGDRFGESVAINGDTAVIGAVGKNDSRGAAYVFALSGATMIEQQKLTARNRAPNDDFGWSVAISGDTVVVGTLRGGGAINAPKGSAYVFVRSGETWSQQQELTSSDVRSDADFGESVSISGDTIVVLGTDGVQAAAYVFARSGGTWTERQKLTASDGDYFAGEVAISGATVVVGYYYKSSAFVFECAECQAITLDPASLPNGVEGASYNRSVTASGGVGPYNYSVSSGSLPPGLSLDPATGSISGMPTMPGRYDFTITATDGSVCPGHRDYRLVIDCPVITVRPANPNLPPGRVGAPYAGAFTANGGLAPYSFRISAGALPSGLTLDPVTGALSGAPAASGTFSFTIRATDSGGCSGSTAYVLTVNCPTIQITPANPNLPNGTAGSPFNGTFTVTGGTAPYTFSITNGALPGGLTLDAATGAVSGAPTVTGEFSFQVRVTDGFGCFASRAYVLTINCPTINVEPANSNLPNGAVGTAYNQTFSATGGVGAYAFDVVMGALPNGLTLDASTGALSGAPTARGAFNFVIRATDGNGCVGRRPYRIVVN